MLSQPLNGTNLDIRQQNRELPFTPSKSWILQEADKNNFNFPTGVWLQAFFDTTFDPSLTGPPQLAVWSGATNDDGSKQANIVVFPFSGALVPFKSKGIFTSGVDWRGVTITSTPIGSTKTSDLLLVVVYGGAY